MRGFFSLFLNFLDSEWIHPKKNPLAAKGNKLLEGSGFILGVYIFISKKR